MASVTSNGASPHSPLYDLDPGGDTDESWQYLDYSSSGPASVGFLPSPASGSLNGYAIIGQISPPVASRSPAQLIDMENEVLLPASMQSEFDTDGVFSNIAANLSLSREEEFLTPQQYLLGQSNIRGLSQQDLADLAPFMRNFEATFLSEPGQTSQSQQHTDPTAFQGFSDGEYMPLWDPPDSSPGQDVFTMDDLVSLTNEARTESCSPKSSNAKSDTSGKSADNIRKVKVGKVEKKKPDQAGKFVIMTPTSIGAHTGRGNIYECFEAEAMRATQKGRKGPLANETKKNALQVRRLGACFCCHSRKVKCDKERPCKHCKRLMIQVPQVVCWQFQDFLTVLFPEFIRGHFKKDEMAKFLEENVEAFDVGGIEHNCRVELFSGPRFAATLSIQAKFFTAKTCDVLQHWHMSVDQQRVELLSNGSAPIAVELNSGAQKDQLRKHVKTYIKQIIDEKGYSEQLTESFRSTKLPTKILTIAQQYAKRSESTIVKRALSIYAMHYVMTRHLCLTRQNILALQPTGLVPQNVPWVTPRVLARQIKSIVDELIMREMQQLFDLFSKSLKPKLRREWAPCLISFLVLCLFMEAVETTAENFVMSQNEINLRNANPPEYQRTFALNICKEVENMPFKQFAYQFHNVYQTHTKDAGTKSFNPLFDDSFAEQGELDDAATDMINSLKELFHGEDWQDLQYLAADDILLNREDHPFPLDTSFLYTGRLVAKFLLSFMDDSYIFASQI